MFFKVALLKHSVLFRPSQECLFCFWWIPCWVDHLLPFPLTTILYGTESVLFWPLLNKYEWWPPIFRIKTFLKSDSFFYYFLWFSIFKNRQSLASDIVGHWPLWCLYFIIYMIYSEVKVMCDALLWYKCVYIESHNPNPLPLTDR